ncbi:MAG: prepilin-type N-terminal cleavage/methylation domain-containing protein [Solirubrobacteraceae bacterium]
MTRIRRCIARLRDQRGFTLIELLVAMIAGVIVLGALVVILQVTINQTSRINETAQVNQTGRTTMTKIVDELQSACLGRGFAPVQESSTPNTLRFAAAFSSAADIKASEAAEHQIVWSKAGETLTEYKYAGTSGENTGIAFSTTKESTTGTRIGEKIAQANSTTPIFRYYKYRETPTSSSETPESALVEIPLATETTTLGSAAAKEVAAVIVTFKAGVLHQELLASETKARESVPSELSDQVTFAFAAPTSESKITDGPCE